MTTAKIYQFPVSTLREVATELVALHRASLVRQLTWREQARYVRLYSNGNTANDLNHYVEVEVFGKPAS